MLLAITVKHREYTLLACISHVWATEGLPDEGKKKENRTASGTSLRSMILPEMISGAQLSHIWSQKELIPLSATSDKTKHTFLTLLMRWKGKQRFKPEISGWKHARASFKCNNPFIATLLHLLFFWLMCQHLKGTFAQCVRKGVRTWDCVRRQDLTEASYDPARSDRLTHACGAKTVRVDVQQVPVSH